jgi:hypothetical protein
MLKSKKQVWRQAGTFPRQRLDSACTLHHWWIKWM